jgi:hypothetical protein
VLQELVALPFFFRLRIQRTRATLVHKLPNVTIEALGRLEGQDLLRAWKAGQELQYLSRALKSLLRVRTQFPEAKLQNLGQAFLVVAKPLRKVVRQFERDRRHLPGV